MDVGLFSGVHDFFLGSAGLSVGDIFPDGAAEEIDVLLNDADLAAERFQRQIPHVFSIDGHPASGHVIESGKQIADGSLAGPGRSYQSHRTACRNLKRNIREYKRIVIRIMEGDIFIGNGSFHLGEGLCIRRVLDLCLSFHHVQITAESGEPFLHHFHQFYQDLDRADEDADIEGVHGQIYHVHPSLGDQISSVYQSHQVHHTLEEEIASGKGSHTPVVIVLGL